MGCSDSKGGDFQNKRSIAERRGFSSNAAKINTSRFRTTTTPTSSSLNPLGSSCRSPCLTIPPGISPTALLDSPIMLPNSQAMPSPTTGTYFQLSMFTNQQSMKSSEQSTKSSEQGKVDDLRTVTDATVPSFKFKPRATNVDPKSLSHFSTSLNQVSSNCNMMKGRNSDSQHGQVQPSVDISVNTDFPKRYDFDTHLYNNVKMVDDANVNATNSDMVMSHSEEASDESTQPKNVIHGSDIEQQPVLEGDQKETSNATGIVRSSEDGYNWRKYGQKQVKGCEYPRSYYKCTQSSCLVRKKVERSQDGQITAIIYKGSHNHLKPHNINRASALSNDEKLDMGEASASGVKVDGELDWRNFQSRIRNSQHGLDWNADFQERVSSDSTGTQLSDPISTSKAKSDDNPELSSTLASHDGNEDGTTQTLASLEDDAEHIESQSKRRKKESNLGESNLPPNRAVREPRVVIQIETEVDILDDGYRWRKYGQKVVKGNPNPRSYYKCTSTGCPVRKHVERASHNIKYVLTTYEGKHNHGVPTARNSNHFRSSDGRLPPAGANSQMALTLTRNASTPNPETQVQSLAPHFDRKPEIANEFLRSNLVGSFSSDMKFGPSSMYQMKYPSLNNTMPYGSYGLNHDRLAAPQGGSLSSAFPDFSMPSNLPSSSGNFSMNGINFNRVQPMGPVHQTFHSGQHVKEIDSGFMRPKQEQKDDKIYGTCLPPVDHANASQASSSASPSIYQRAMQNFPA
ncbi:unnamed protein product [Lupinus luteus]|uniref:WRKY domain-containing protein n=1 Tax=Lupinus luteus TaxID=3873 RepID=A0AAV1W1J2_LUPLU